VSRSPAEAPGTGSGRAPDAAPTRPQRKPRAGYHHGDLRSALIDAAVELISERGIGGFSLAEAGRRVGVSAAAPYRHFAEREALLAAVAVRAITDFTTMIVDAAPPELAPTQRLAALGAAYVRFAGQNKALFESIFAAGIDKTRYPEVHEAEAPLDEVMMNGVNALCPDDPAAAQELATALVAIMHGFATMLLDGEFARDQDAISTASAKAARAVAAMIAGRACFASADSVDRAP
jgi:AcrR family transcriptional regulator